MIDKISRNNNLNDNIEKSYLSENIIKESNEKII